MVSELITQNTARGKAGRWKMQERLGRGGQNEEVSQTDCKSPGKDERE